MPPTEAPGFLRRRRGSILVGLGILLVVALALGFALTQSDKTEESNKSDDAKIADKAGKSDKPDMADKAEKSDKSDKSDKGDKADKLSPTDLPSLEVAVQRAQASADAAANGPDAQAAGEALTKARRRLVDAVLELHAPAGIAKLERRQAQELSTSLSSHLDWFPSDAGLQLRQGLALARLRDFRRALEHFGKAVALDPGLRRDPALHTVLNGYLIQGTPWNRTLTLRLLREHWGKAPAEEVMFLTTAINDERTDADHRHEVYHFARSRGLKDGIDEDAFRKAQLRLSTTCETRLEAARWFLEHGTRDHVPFLKAEAKHYHFNMANGRTQDAKCYRPTLLKAISAAGAREPKN